MAARLSDEVKALLDAPNFWHLATLNPDGSPHSTVMWIDRRGDKVMFNTALGRVKPRNLAHDPRVALSLATKYVGVETYPFLQPGRESRYVHRRASPCLVPASSHAMSATTFDTRRRPPGESSG